jgi:undecaprenyl diphosphate synthase
MAGSTPEEIDAARTDLGVPEERIPRSIAIIMDGNGRWARQRDLPRPFGHRAGAKTVRQIVQACARLGIEALTLYSFSLENWSRPQEEIEALMGLYAEYLREERPTLMENNVRLRHLGRRDNLPQVVLDELDTSIEVSSQNTGMYLCLALNYGSRAEITDAVRDIARRVQAGECIPEDISEEMISTSLDTAGVPDPDLLIRTSGELRISNYLLWQISYTEFHVTECHWPDFDEDELHRAIRIYANRNRRFGGVNPSNR